MRRLARGKRSGDEPAEESKTGGSFLASCMPCLVYGEAVALEDRGLQLLEGINLDKYVRTSTLYDLLKNRDTVLIKGSWLVERWRKGQAANDMPTLMRRQEIEERHPGAVWGVDDLFRCQAKGTVSIIAVSHGGLCSQHPNLEGDMLDALCHAMELMLKSTPVHNLAVFVSFCSLFQLPRTPSQEAAHSRAMANTHLWYIHEGTRVWNVSKTEDVCGWTALELALGDLLHRSNFMLDIRKVDETCTTWQRVLAVCKHHRRSPLAPNALAEVLRQRVFASPEERTVAAHKYEEAFFEAIAAAKVLNFNNLAWGDREAQQVALILPQCLQLEKVALQSNNITEDGVRALISAIPKCRVLQELWLTQNSVRKADKGVRESLLNAWIATGRRRDNLHM